MREEREKKIKEQISELVSQAQLLLAIQVFRITQQENSKTFKEMSKELKDKYSNLSKQHPLHEGYQRWYSRALPVIRQLAADRLEEFETLYRVDKRKEIDVTTYGISDYLQGISTTRGLETNYYHSTFQSKFQVQIDVLKSISDRVGDVLADIRGVLEADLLDDQISAALELLRNGHLRAAGTIAGVVLEAHLSHVAERRQIKGKKKDPSISDLNELLKAAGVIDVPQWRQIQRLGDLRNLCAHKKERDPTKEEVDELIASVKKISATLF